MEYLGTLTWLISRLEEISGGRVELLIHAGTALLVILVIGKLLARYVFRSDAGAVTALLAGILPLVLGIAVWAALTTWFNPELFELRNVTVDLALLVGTLTLLGLGGALTARLLDTAFVKALFFLILVYAASAGGILISHASLTVFGAGAGQVEQSQDRLGLEN